MHTYLLDREQWLPKSLDDVFSFFSRPKNLQIVTPPWLGFRMVDAPQALVVGSLNRIAPSLARTANSLGRPKSPIGVLRTALWTVSSAAPTPCGTMNTGLNRRTAEQE